MLKLQRWFKMLRKIRFFGFVFGLCIICISCGDIPQKQEIRYPTPTIIFSPTPTPLKFNMKQGWVEGKPCKAPCWENITPGLTTGTQAYATLQRNPLVKNVISEIHPNNNDKMVITWDWKSPDESGGEIHFFKNNNKVFWIRPYYYGVDNIRLKALIATYGNPSHIYVTNLFFKQNTYDKSKPVYLLDIYYKEKGFAVKAEIQNPADFNNQLLVREPEFFIPSDYGIELINGIGVPPDLKWEGFKPIDFYCQKIDSCATFLRNK